MKCPPGSGWNTTHCVIKKVMTTTTSKTMEIDPVPSNTYGSTLKSSSLSSSSSFFEGVSGGSSSSSSTNSASLTGSKTIGEEMNKLGLDYEGFRKKIAAEGGSGSSWSYGLDGHKCSHRVQHEGDVAEPIIEKKSHLSLTTDWYIHQTVVLMFISWLPSIESYRFYKICLI